jgi:hypothetical protein
VRPVGTAGRRCPGRHAGTGRRRGRAGPWWRGRARSRCRAARRRLRADRRQRRGQVPGCTLGRRRLGRVPSGGPRQWCWPLRAGRRPERLCDHEGMPRGTASRWKTRYAVRLTVPRRGGWRAWGAVRPDFERALAGAADPAIVSAEIASELRRGAGYVRVTVALTVVTADVAAAAAQVQPEPTLTGPGDTQSSAPVRLPASTPQPAAWPVRYRSYLMIGSSSSGHSLRMSAPLVAHKPEHCPFGHSLACGKPQKISWMPCICGPVQERAKHGRGMGSSDPVVRHVQ